MDETDGACCSAPPSKVDGTQRNKSIKDRRKDYMKDYLDLDALDGSTESTRQVPDKVDDQDLDDHPAKEAEPTLNEVEFQDRQNKKSLSRKKSIKKKKRREEKGDKTKKPKSKRKSKSKRKKSIKKEEFENL